MTRELCSVVRQSDGALCDYVAGHPSTVHVTWLHGWPHHWSNPDTEWSNVQLPHSNDQAPEALK